ncbi:hypothetical protein JCM19235_4116 [Vibrio maritimus]|uniref:Uncharacterized protein n=1 Tax=Vibrio maritimus TaxID=990268 RepID=A0A090RXB0_9VIBR|nr:hypothetical protein JCM19235_4116 [Vibrio maritimus]
MLSDTDKFNSLSDKKRPNKSDGIASELIAMPNRNFGYSPGDLGLI